MSEDRPLYEVLAEMGKDMPPPDAAEIAERLRNLSDVMALLGCDMEYVGGIGPMGEHGREMMGAAKIAAEWADEIEREAVAVATHKGGRDG
jgi:hypothetical protein